MFASFEIRNKEMNRCQGSDTNQEEIQMVVIPSDDTWRISLRYHPDQLTTRSARPGKDRHQSHPTWGDMSRSDDGPGTCTRSTEALCMWGLVPACTRLHTKDVALYDDDPLIMKGKAHRISKELDAFDRLTILIISTSAHLVLLHKTI